MLRFSISIRRHQLDSTKNYFHPTSILSATTWYSIPYGHGPIEVWLFCGILSVEDVLSPSTKPCVVKTSVDGPSANALVDNPSASQRVCSAEWLLSGEPFKESTFSWSRFQRLSCPLTFFYTPELIHTLLQSNDDRLAYIESFSSLSVGQTTAYQTNCLSSLCIWQLSTYRVEIKFRKFTVLPALHVQIPIRNSRQTWVL